MEFLKLYDKENENILHNMSWLNKNSFFDKSIGTFEVTDLFKFLENINKFDYHKDLIYDDIYYILEYTQGSILYLINNINKEIRREHRVLPLAQAKEFDKKSIIWLSKQDGRTIKEKLKSNKIKTVKRYRDVDTYENRIFKILLKRIVLIEDVRKGFQSNDYLVNKIKQWLRSEDAKSINEYGNIIFNNLLLHHPHYSKVFKSYKWLNRLDEKVNTYINTYPNQISSILNLTVLSKLQFKTDEFVLPKALIVDYSNFQLQYDNPLLFKKNKLIGSQNRDLSKAINDLICKQNRGLILKNIDKSADTIISKLKIEEKQNRNFVNDNRAVEDAVFIDMFRLFPVVRFNNKTISYPIFLKQKIGNDIVNANNTKIIDLNHCIFTLPELLKTYDTDILKLFMNDLLGYINTKQLNYIIPDYVNIFEFAKIKKSINSYFPSNRNVPKSILTGLEYLFQKRVKKDDTLISIQKDHNNDVYVTPLLVKFDKKLKSITGGFFLEKHPTKRIEGDYDILDELNKSFDRNLSSSLINKFLQDGIKGIKEKNIYFYYNGKAICLNNEKSVNNRVNSPQKFRNLFNNKHLFKIKKSFRSEVIDVKDNYEDNESNLHNFERLLDYEKQGYTLWKEHLPRLAMQLPINGYMDEFVFVDDSSEVTNSNIKIENHFIIPADTKELSFPLIFGDKNINYEAYISSNELPVKEDLECELKLIYNYEAESPYELTFRAINNSIFPLKVKWKEIKEKAFDNLPVPDFPDRKNWTDFTKYPKEDGKSYSDLLNWCSSTLEILKKFDDQCEGGFIRRNNDYYCYVDVKGAEVLCHKSDFIEKIDFIDSNKGDAIYLSIKKDGKGKLSGKDISLRRTIDSVKIKIFNIRFPVLTIWNNSNSLSESGVPNDFRNALFEGVQNAISILESEDMPDSLKDELFFFLSCLHKDSPEYVSKRLSKVIKNIPLFKKYYRNIAFAIGDAELEWQKDLLNKVLNSINNKDLTSITLDVLSIALWRSEELINKLKKSEIKNIRNKLYDNLKIDITKVEDNRKSKSYQLTLSMHLELLLALLRIRGNNDKQFMKILSPNEKRTQEYVKLIDGITKVVIEKNINLTSRIELQIEKPKSFNKTPDLLYALRTYLTGDSGAANSIRVLGVSDD
ncbi:hypothetical protein V6246_00755 [Algibacter sp. TI.3.09]|uniref:hypothetical protein n=1 Tax=Algibacter sp. TI.3.09 TaxID=3121298 RepID=UPI00311EE9E8